MTCLGIVAIFNWIKATLDETDLCLLGEYFKAEFGMVDIGLFVEYLIIDECWGR